jgi:hypothetical protein
MRSLRPEQIILLLVFILVPLLNLLVRWLKRRAREQQRPVPAGPRAAAPVERAESSPAPIPSRVRMIEPGLPRQGLRTAPPPPPPQPVIRRAGPLGGRVAVRRAVVAMTILGPCRALEEPPSSQPVGSLQQGIRRR